jgi:hypothetical protein
MRNHLNLITITSTTILLISLAGFTMQSMAEDSGNPAVATTTTTTSSPTSTSTTPPPLPAATTPPAAPKPPQNPPRYCPLAKELTRNGMQWSVGSKWKSYSDSFVKEIASFIGAQWVGVKVGKIICIYRGKDNGDFPVALEETKSHIIQEPTSASWSNFAQGRKMCNSSNVFDCAFYIKPEEDNSNVYEEIKYKTPSSTIPFINNTDQNY